MRRAVLPCLPNQFLVVPGRRAHEHAATRGRQRVGGDGGVFQRVPAFLQHDALLGVHDLGLHGRQAEEFGVEAGDVIEKTAPFGHAAPVRLGVRVVEAGHVPATGRYLRHPVRAGQQQVPKLVGVVGAGIATGHADHRDGVRRRHVRAKFRAKLRAKLRGERGRRRLLPGHIPRNRRDTLAHGGGQTLEGGMVVEIARLQPGGEAGVDGMRQFDAADGIQAQVEERHVAGNVLRVHLQRTRQHGGQGAGNITGFDPGHGSDHGRGVGQWSQTDALMGGGLMGGGGLMDGGLMGGGKRTQAHTARRGGRRHGRRHGRRGGPGPCPGLRLRLSRQAVETPTHLVGTERGRMHGQFLLDHGGQFGQQPAGEFAFQGLQGFARLVGQTAGKGQRLASDVGGGGEDRLGAQRLQLRSGEGLSGVHHPGGDIGPQPLLQDQGRTHSGREAVTGEHRAEQAFLRHHHHVGVKSEQQSPARGVALDRRDHRNVAVQQSAIHERDVAEPRPALGDVGQYLGSGAHAENAVRAGDDDRFVPGLLVDGREGLHQPQHQIVGEHVAVGPVPHGDQGDFTLDRLQRDGISGPGAGPDFPIRDAGGLVPGRSGWGRRRRRGSGGGGLVPVTLALIGIGRQTHPPAPGVSVQGRPRNLAALDPQRRQGGEVAVRQGLVRPRPGIGGSVGGAPLMQAGGAPAVQEGGKSRPDLSRIRRHQRQPFRHLLPAGLQGEGDVGENRRRLPRESGQLGDDGLQAGGRHAELQGQPGAEAGLDAPDPFKERRLIHSKVGRMIVDGNIAGPGAQHIGERRKRRAFRAFAVGGGRERVEKLSRGLAQGAGSPGRKRQQDRPGHPVGSPRRRKVFLDHQMSVGTAGAERGKAGAARPGGAVGPFGRNPRPGPALEVERNLVPFDIGIERVGMERGHQFPPAQLQHQLGQPGDAGRRLQMADGRFGRADGAAPPGGDAGRAEGLGQPRDLDGIAQ